MKIKIVSTGRLPPPVGGVTIFLKYFIEALILKKNVQHEFFNIKNIYKYKSSFFHINSSNYLKRFFYVLFGKFFFKKVFIVKHGGVFNLNNFLERLSIYLADGVFCLNDEVKTQLDKLNINNFKHTTVFIENKIERFKRDKNNNKPRVLFYINNDSVLNGKSVYGTDFIASCVDEIVSDYELVVIDLSSTYKRFFSMHPNIEYIKEPENFINVLSNIDVYIRPTRTDGMSVALLEAGICGVKCLASNAVERPGFVFTYQLDSKYDFLEKLHSIVNKENNSETVLLSSVDDVLIFMKS